MSLSLDDLGDLPSPFYRVAIKALIMRDSKLLLAKNQDGDWELPGGGWEHDETVQTCLERELDEELGAELLAYGPVEHIFRGESGHGWKVMRLLVRATIGDAELAPGDDLVAAGWFTKAQFLELPISIGDAGIKDYVDKIYS
ncbi:MAG: ADP-ribose pyrophosphatase [Candidatus Saccharibacteria bacterium]|nr:ADP-ribose pyrophosphatase [Candidatus Saccharibacteria bacterium]